MSYNSCRILDKPYTAHDMYNTGHTQNISHTRHVTYKTRHIQYSHLSSQGKQGEQPIKQANKHESIGIDKAINSPCQGMHWPRKGFNSPSQGKKSEHARAQFYERWLTTEMGGHQWASLGAIELNPLDPVLWTSFI